MRGVGRYIWRVRVGYILLVVLSGEVVLGFAQQFLEARKRVGEVHRVIRNGVGVEGTELGCWLMQAQARIATGGPHHLQKLWAHSP